MKRLIFILLLLSNFLPSIEVNLETNPTQESELYSGDEQKYFGERLFKGKFKENRQFRYNAKYVVAIDDRVSVKMWGTHDYLDDNLTVDKQGNIFIPEVGSVYLLGITADRVQEIIQQSVSKVFNSNVHLYANIKQYQDISLMVSGTVVNAGLYSGLSTDSIVQFIDKAGGIIRGEGSYRHIEILRDNQVIKSIDLYDFLTKGIMDNFQFKNADVILIKPLKRLISVTGDVRRPYFFELLPKEAMVEDILRYILPKEAVNSFILTTWRDKQEITTEYSLNKANTIPLKHGDKINFVSNYYIKNIEVHIEGEHKGTNFLSIPKGSTLYDILSKVQFTPLSDIKHIQFYRKKIALIQQSLLDVKLKDLEARVLSNNSTTKDEAAINQAESTQLLSFIQRAKEVEQKGQVVLRKHNNLKKIILEQGDRIFIAKKSNIVVVQGEVSIPTAIAYDKEMKLSDYIDFCGGYTDDADMDKILLIKANGRVIRYHDSLFSKSEDMMVEPSDSILVLQEVKTKNMLIFKDLTQILYQIALGAAVILKL
jgi:protein involved in polysaccharide export with SLBB domain